MQGQAWAGSLLVWLGCLVAVAAPLLVPSRALFFIFAGGWIGCQPIHPGWEVRHRPGQEPRREGRARQQREGLVALHFAPDLQCTGASAAGGLHAGRVGRSSLRVPSWSGPSGCGPGAVAGQAHVRWQQEFQGLYGSASRPVARSGGHSELAQGASCHSWQGQGAGSRGQPVPSAMPL